MDPIIDVFLQAPAELSPIAAYRYAVEQVFGQFSDPEWAEEAGRQALMYTSRRPQARSTGSTSSPSGGSPRHSRCG